MESKRDLINIAPIFYGISMVPKHHWESYGYALLAIAGADGDVSDPEMDWLLKDLAEGVSVPDEVVAAWEDYNFEGADLEEIFMSFNVHSTVNFAKLLVYDAIRMASADDDFADDERDSMAEAARILRLSPEVMLSIEALVDLEKAADKLRVTLF
ncbi:MAG: TerB family tellurite resistance protein [Bacteroidota bacterium]